MAEIYVLDANVFIEAASRYYGFDLVPRFWQALVEHAATGRVRSIDRVRQELLRGNDDLAEWARGEFQNWFASTDQDDVVEVYRQIMTWVQQQSQFLPGAKADFARGADGWLVAYAKTHGYVVVTHERFNAEKKRKVPIPNVCTAFGVSTVDTFAMLRALGVRIG